MRRVTFAPTDVGTEGRKYCFVVENRYLRFRDAVDVVPYEAAGCLGQNQIVFPRNKKGIKRILNVPYAGEKIMLFTFPWLGFVGDDVHGVPLAWDGMEI